MTVSHEPVMELVRASLIPVENKLTPRRDLPACRVVLRVARATELTDGVHPVHDLAAGAGVAASGLTLWLAKERDMDVKEVLKRMPGTGPDGLVAGMLRTLLTGPKGMDQAADWLMELFDRDQDAYLDLIVDLGSYSAVCIEILDRLGVSEVEQSLEDLEEMLRDYYSPSG
ncbi:hypothetical protein ACFVHW_07715 [Streptomyces sp. NPDC127110]|uniref:hypothetical protein n=1 Tax=Streptomyces sp. NPDC127110 TaxID=3345362 RepID=UPI00363AD2FF